MGVGLTQAVGGAVRSRNSHLRLTRPVLKSYGLTAAVVVRCGPGGPNRHNERDAMNVIKSQTFRVVMLLSALASSSLVLMAGRRWL